MPRPRASSAARAREQRTRSSSASASSRNTLQRERSAAFTANEGFSVVAPMSVMRPVLDVREERVLLRLVEPVNLVDEHDRPLARVREPLLRLADDDAQLRDGAEHRAERHEPGAWSARRAPARASSCRRPGGPQRIIDGTRSLAIARARSLFGPNRCACPTKLRDRRGRIRSASGVAPAREGSRRAAAVKSVLPGSPLPGLAFTARNVARIARSRAPPIRLVESPAAIYRGVCRSTKRPPRSRTGTRPTASSAATSRARSPATSWRPSSRSSSGAARSRRGLSGDAPRRSPRRAEVDPVGRLGPPRRSPRDHAAVERDGEDRRRRGARGHGVRAKERRVLPRAPVRARATSWNPTSGGLHVPARHDRRCGEDARVHGKPPPLDRALPHLTSRDSKLAWTSGQWMTERTGGSDVAISETVARLEVG